MHCNNTFLILAQTVTRNIKPHIKKKHAFILMKLHVQRLVYISAVTKPFQGFKGLKEQGRHFCPLHISIQVAVLYTQYSSTFVCIIQ